jgi:hypothetical protein
MKAPGCEVVEPGFISAKERARAALQVTEIGLRSGRRGVVDHESEGRLMT